MGAVIKRKSDNYFMAVSFPPDKTCEIHYTANLDEAYIFQDIKAAADFMIENFINPNNFRIIEQ